MATRSIIVPVSLAVLVVLCPYAHANVVAVDHYAAGWDYDPSMAYTIKGAEASGGATQWLQAMPFVAPTSGDLVEGWITLGWQSGTRELGAFITDDDGGQPGGVRRLVWVSGAGGQDEVPPVSDPYPLAPIHFKTLCEGSLLVAGQKYWLAVEPLHAGGEPDNGQFLWYFNKVGHRDARAMGEAPLGPWTIFADQTQAAFRIDIVPEPTGLWLLAVGGLCIAGRWVRRRLLS
jgi:hypothetical protein